MVFHLLSLSPFFLLPFEIFFFQLLAWDWVTDPFYARVLPPTEPTPERDEH